MKILEIIIAIIALISPVWVLQIAFELGRRNEKKNATTKI